MHYKLKIRLLTTVLLLFAMVPAMADGFSAKEVVLEHIKDSHEWHVTDFGDGKSLVIPLPVIVNSSTGWHVFCSSKFEHHADANGLRQGPYGLAIATEGDHAGKIVVSAKTSRSLMLFLRLSRRSSQKWINFSLSMTK